MVRFGLKIKDLLVTCYLGKTRSNLDKNFLRPQKYALPYTYELQVATLCTKNLPSLPNRLRKIIKHFSVWSEQSRATLERNLPECLKKSYVFL